MENNASCQSDKLILKTVECKMSSKMCLLKSDTEISSCEDEELVSKVIAGSSDICGGVVKKSDAEKPSCKVEDIVSKVVAGTSDICGGVVKEEYEICDTNGFSSTVLCGQEIDNLMPLEYVKVELTEENGETDVTIQKVAVRQEELCHKHKKSCTVENKSSSLPSDGKSTNIVNEGCSESVQDSVGSEVKEDIISIAEKQKVSEIKGNAGNNR
jgi:hypothetical protein